MPTQTSDSVSREAKKIYDERLRSLLEPSHRNEFVAIEPESGDFFLGKTLSEAIGNARTKHPERLVHTLRVGHKAAVQFGLQLG